MKKVKKLISSLLVVAMLLTAAPLSGFVGLDIDFSWFDFSTKSSALSSSGSCGDNVTYTFDEDTGLLKISGTGAMWNYSVDMSSPFYKNSSIKSVVINSGVTSIGNYIFRNCTGLLSVSIPNSVISIGYGAFELCSSLTSIIIPESVTIIDSYAFRGCTSLISITIPDSVTSIGSMAFEFCSSLTNIAIPDGITSINYGTFSRCSSLTSITIPNSVTSIDAVAFEECCSLTSVTILDSVTNIGNYAFANCSSLISVTIPDSVISIGYGAFELCSSLTSITIPESVTSINYGAFNCCRRLTSITIDESNKYYSSDKYGVLYNKDKTKLIQYPIGNLRESFIIPNSVTRIESSAFYSCSSLANVKIPDGVKSIDDSAFERCIGLTSITIPDSLSSIGNHAFYGCNSLQDVYYAGSEEEWHSVSIGIYNECLTNATIHYNYVVEPEIVDITDEITGIKVSAPSGTFDGDVTLKVEEILSDSSFEIIGKVNGKSKAKVFTIETYVDGQSVQPNGDVTIRIPVPDGFNAEKCKLYYLNTSSKNPEEIAFLIEDGYFVFTTNHFGEWAIIQIANKPIVSVNDIGLNYKKSAALKPSVTVEENASYTVTYTSSDTSVARVDENGKVYGAKKGSTEITVTVTDEYGNTVSDTCKVNVTYAWWQWIIVIVLFGWIWY